MDQGSKNLDSVLYYLTFFTKNTSTWLWIKKIPHWNLGQELVFIRFVELCEVPDYVKSTTPNLCKPTSSNNFQILLRCQASHNMVTILHIYQWADPAKNEHVLNKIAPFSPAASRSKAKRWRTGLSCHALIMYLKKRWNPIDMHVRRLYFT